MVDLTDQSQHHIAPLSTVRGCPDVRVPSDKSLTHRALMFAGWAEGRSCIEQPLWGEDCQATADVLEKLGCDVERSQLPKTLTIVSPGRQRWLKGPHRLDFANSGTTARLMLGLLSSVDGLSAECDGDASLRRRPMGRVTDPLSKLGAEFVSKAAPGHLPITIDGRILTAGEIDVETSSAQVKSALVLAALNAQGRSVIRCGRGGRDHTERLVRKLGGPLHFFTEGEQEVIAVEGPWQPQAFRCAIPADPSSAAFLAATLTAIGTGEMILRSVLTNPTRFGFFSVIARMGVQVERMKCRESEAFVEDASDLRIVVDRRLQATTVLAEEVPSLIDELPVLAVVAAKAYGTTKFLGIEELRVKESDRLRKIEELLAVMKVAFRSGHDWIEIDGQTELDANIQYHSAGDHRMAMSAAVASVASKQGGTVHGSHCVDVSFPGFFDVLQSLR